MIGPFARHVLAADGRHHAAGVRGVGHDVEQLVVDPQHDDVVGHRAGLVEQVRVLRPTGRDPPQVVAQGVLQVVERGRPLDAHGAEMTDVERHRALTTGPMLGHGARGVGQGHLPPAEGHHLRPEGDVRRVERRVTIRVLALSLSSAATPPD